MLRGRSPGVAVRILPALAIVALLVGWSATHAGSGETPIVGDTEIPADVSCDPPADVGSWDDPGISPPVVVTKVEPTYTEALRKDRVEGEVTLRAVICTDGVPRRFEVESEKGKGLRESALQAVRQWRYRPAQRDGMPVAMKYAITVAFRLSGSKPSGVETSSGPIPSGSRIAQGDVTLPVLRTKVEPVYPAEHRLSGGDGKVLFQARIEKDGTVGAIKTLQATSYAFELAAREAVKHWVYEPARMKGEPVAIDFTISVAFKLRGAPFSKNRGKVTAPTLRHDVPPVYPATLLPAGRRGSVSVEIFVARDGRVEKFEILSATDPAFAEAVRAVVPQWKFAPGRLDGAPTATSLKLTIPFEPPVTAPSSPTQ